MSLLSRGIDEPANTCSRRIATRYTPICSQPPMCRKRTSLRFADIGAALSPSAVPHTARCCNAEALRFRARNPPSTRQRRDTQPTQHCNVPTYAPLCTFYSYVYAQRVIISTASQAGSSARSAFRSLCSSAASPVVRVSHSHLQCIVPGRTGQQRAVRAYKATLMTVSSCPCSGCISAASIVRASHSRIFLSLDGLASSVGVSFGRISPTPYFWFRSACESRESDEPFLWATTRRSTVQRQCTIHEQHAEPFRTAIQSRATLRAFRSAGSPERPAAKTETSLPTYLLPVATL